MVFRSLDCSAVGLEAAWGLRTTSLWEDSGSRVSYQRRLVQELLVQCVEQGWPQGDSGRLPREEDSSRRTHHPRRRWWRCHVPHWVGCIRLHQEDWRPLVLCFSKVCSVYPPVCVYATAVVPSMCVLGSGELVHSILNALLFFGHPEAPEVRTKSWRNVVKAFGTGTGCNQMCRQWGQSMMSMAMICKAWSSMKQWLEMDGDGWWCICNICSCFI